MAVKNQVLRLTWRNQAGRTYAMTINNPVDDLTSAQVEAFMNMVVQKNIIQSSGGDLVEPLDAHLIDTVDNDLYTPA